MLHPQRIPPPRFPDVFLRTPTNWTAVAFLALLGSVHLGVAIPASLHGRWEGSLSFFFAILFLISAMVARDWSIEIGLLPSRRQIRVRTGTKRWHVERRIPFEAISSVRLTLNARPKNGAQIEIICQSETLEIPATSIPNQQALFFSMLLEVPLVKVSAAELTGPAIQLV